MEPGLRNFLKTRIMFREIHIDYVILAVIHEASTNYYKPLGPLLRK
jgi:hypothetical protein